MFAFYLRYKKSALSLACVTPAPRVTAAAVGSSVGRPAIRIQSLDTRERALADKVTEGEGGLRQDFGAGNGIRTRNPQLGRLML